MKVSRLPSASARQGSRAPGLVEPGTNVSPFTHACLDMKLEGARRRARVKTPQSQMQTEGRDPAVPRTAQLHPVGPNLKDGSHFLEVSERALISKMNNIELSFITLYIFLIL